MRSYERFRRDRGGNVAVIFALSLIPMIGIIGIGVDYGRLLATKAQLDAAADAAALAAATEASNLIQQLLPLLAVSFGQQAGQELFATDAARAASQTGRTITPQIQVVPAGRTVTATVTWTATQNNAFGGLFGMPTAGIGGTAKASLDQTANKALLTQ